MSNIFSNAMKGALSVRVNNDGLRHVDRNSDSGPGPGNFRGRGRSRGNDGGRWQRGGYRGNRGSYRARGRGRGRGRGSDTIDDEGDAVMNSYGSYSDGGSRDGRRERSPEASSQRCSWKVTIPDARKHSREWLMRRIGSSCRLPFREINYHVEGANVVFFVNDDAVASALEDTSNRITTKDGSRILIRVTPTGNSQHGGPTVNNSENEMQHLKTCLAARYDPALLKLDLNKLFSDPLLKNYDAKIAQPQYMNKILDLIHSVCPNLKILDLSNNRIIRLDNLSRLSQKCPELDELILSYNDVRFTGELSKIKDHKTITKLWFKGNPGQLQYSANNSAYLADVRRRLPNLIMLDGVELPKVVKFELESTTVETHIPDRKDTFAANANDFELAKLFIRNYFEIYDNGDRQNLLNAYHNDAAFSLCCNSSIVSKGGSHALTFYTKNSRNLRNIKDSKQKRVALLKYKKLNIVAFLTELPQTKHWLDSFSLDLTFTTLHMLIFTVQGIFLEGKMEMTPRGFSRTFIAQREADGSFLVMNDHLHVRNVTNEQLDLVEDAKYNNVPSNSSAPAPVVHSEVQQELIRKFCAESKMNPKYSVMCLEAAGWDFEKAAMKFMELQKSGTIPEDAFKPDV